MRLPRIPSMLHEVENSSYLGLFSIFRLEMVGCSSSYGASFAKANCASPRRGQRASLGRKVS